MTDYEKSVVKAVLCYYNHNYDFLIAHLDEAVTWYGPRRGDYIVGKSNFIDMLAKVNKNTKFIVDDINTKLFVFSASIYCVIMTYQLEMIRSNGERTIHYHRTNFTCKRLRNDEGKNFWLCQYIETSNLTPEKTITKNNTPKVISAESKNTPSGKSVFFKSENNSTLYINSSKIEYVEGGKGVFSFLHTTDGEAIKVHHLLKDVKEMLGDDFYRPHSSYIVNLQKVVSCASAGITLKSGEIIPVPVKKLTQVKADIKKYMAVHIIDVY